MLMFAAQLYAQDLAQGFSDLPIVAIETVKETFDGIRDTRFGDDSSWKTLIQKSPISERHYLADVQTQLHDLAKTISSGSRAVFIYNFRIKNCILYDLGKMA